MGEPAMEHFAVSALKVADPICLLDLTLPMENDTRSEAEIVKNWPHIMACSVRVKHREDSFKPEYVIPQLVMSTIRAIKLQDGRVYLYLHHEKPCFQRGGKQMVEHCIAGKNLSSNWTLRQAGRAVHYHESNVLYIRTDK